jgi:hypothetical protein
MELFTHIDTFIFRLCSLAELQADKTRGTGCGYDNEQVWSLSVCSIFNVTGHTVKGHFTSVGSSGNGGGVHCRPDDWSNATFTRCCADVQACPLASNLCSAKTCTSLGWNGGLMSKYGSPGVCGESIVLGSNGLANSGENSWAESDSLCEGIGARLCSATELGVDDETKGAGFSNDSQRSWSSTPCGTGSYIAAFGDSQYVAEDPTERGPRCLPETNSAVVVRCCADEFSCATTSVPKSWTIQYSIITLQSLYVMSRGTSFVLFVPKFARINIWDFVSLWIDSFHTFK